MTGFDSAVLAAVVLSAALGFARGLVSELLALVAWAVAFVVAREFGHLGADWLHGLIAESGLRTVVGYVAIFVAVLVAISLLRFLLKQVLKAAGLGITDRVLGCVFGITRGVLIVFLGVIVGGMTALPKASWWQQATLAPPFETAVMAAKPWLPVEVAKRIRYR